MNGAMTGVEHLVAADLRLAALRSQGILDTPPEEAFDGIVRLAIRLCRTPIGLISFVDADRQWFKARIGFPSCETDLDRSVCKFALGEPDLLIVPDLTADPRTATNPLVTGEPFIRFYAGAPVRTPDGQVLGSLCVIDTVPRPEGLTPEQRDDLRTLADQVVRELLMRRAVSDRDQVVAFQSAELRRARRLDVIAAASTALVSAEDPSAVLEPILRDGAEALGFERACLYDVSHDGRHLRLRHAVNVAPEAREDLRRLPFGTPLVRHRRRDPRAPGPRRAAGRARPSVGRRPGQRARRVCRLPRGEPGRAARRHRLRINRHASV